MKLFNMLGKKKVIDETELLSELAQKNCATAIQFAKDFNKNLDYSEKSIEDLEEILDFYSNDIPTNKPTDSQIWSMAIIFGSYLGETMLKNGLWAKEYHWVKDNSLNLPLLIGKDGWQITPIDKVYKRLINGSIDNVVSFYKFALQKL